jgi:two-component system, OmpR family, KDP operon response regulator KdpE
MADSCFAMKPQPAQTHRILIVEDVQETREAIEVLLRRDGYILSQARDEDEAVEEISAHKPDLILVSIGGLPKAVLGTAQRIRERSNLDENTPVVIFSVQILPEGVTEEIAPNIFVIVPEDFNQLRRLLMQILLGESPTPPRT